jgi:hypothetical protein
VRVNLEEHTSTRWWWLRLGGGIYRLVAGDGQPWVREKWVLVAAAAAGDGQLWVPMIRNAAGAAKI